MRKRYVFPLFNTLIGVVFGAVIGYYVLHLLGGILFGALGGLALGVLLELAFGLAGTENWFYRRRVTVTVLLEIPLAIFLIGPYAYALVETLPDRHEICCETPLDYGASTYEEVNLQVADDVSLAGWYVPPVISPGPVIVLLHGSHGDRLGTAWHARQLIQAGYGIMMYDQRALGESTGRRVSVGWLDPPDLLAVVEYLRQKPEIDPARIGAVGLSLGGHIALNAATQNPEAFNAMWLDGIQAQNMADFPEAQNSGERFATFVNALILRMLEFQLGRKAPSPFIEILPELDRPPTVIVTAGQAEFERAVHQGYRAVVQENVYVWLIEDAGHVGGSAVVPDKYAERLVDFFNAAFGMR